MAKVSKVQKSDGTIIMDISQDTVNANNLLQGATAHGADGEAVQGAVIIPSNATITGAVNGTGELSRIAVNRKCGLAQHNASGTSATPWYKVADVTLATYRDYTITFYVDSGLEGSANNVGILRVYTRIGASLQSPEHLKIRWLLAGADVNLNSFALSYDKSTGVCAIYANCAGAYSSYRFTVLSESDVLSRKDLSVWTVYNAMTGIASLPTGDNVVTAYSELATTQVGSQSIKNDLVFDESSSAQGHGLVSSDNKKEIVFNHHMITLTSSSGNRVSLSDGDEQGQIILRPGDVEISGYKHSSQGDSQSANVHVYYDAIEVNTGNDGIIITNVMQSGTGVNLVIAPDGTICKASSSRNVKHDIEYVKDTNRYHDALMQLKPATFIYNSDKTETQKLGMIAEDVADVCPIAGIVDKNGKVENYDDRAIITLLVAEVQRLNAEIDKLKGR